MIDQTSENETDQYGVKRKKPLMPQGVMDMNKLTAGVPGGHSGVDPTALEILRRFGPRHTAEDAAQDQVGADRAAAGGFGGRVGGFAETKPEYHDDPSLPMAQRMEAFNNRTTRAGLQSLGQDQSDARGRAGLATRIGTPPVPFDLNRLTTQPGHFDPVTGVQTQPNIGYDTTGQPSGMLHTGGGGRTEIPGPTVQPGEVTGITHGAGSNRGMTPYGEVGQAVIPGLEFLNGAKATPEAFGPPAPVVPITPTPKKRVPFKMSDLMPDTIS